MKKNKVNYGNWVPEKMLIICLIVSLLFLGGAIAFIITNIIPGFIVCFILFLIVLVYLIYMFICHELFAFGKGNMMAKVHKSLVDHLYFNGNGKILDIGCGGAALTILCAKTFKEATVIGMDYWGKEWSYAKNQCDKNARLEGVSERCIFEKGDASKLKYDDESFDAVVSNFVFHEVKTSKNKRDVAKEALRVVKKGGCFAFQDLFDQKNLYGDINEFIEELKKEGISEIYYVGKLEDKLNFPKYAKTPWMINGVGLIYGKK